MNILVNSKYTDGISYKLHYQGFCKINNIKFNDFKNYDKYDVVLFFIYDLKKSDLKLAKKLNKNIIIGLIDPRTKLDKSMLNNIDFIVVDSIEMQDYFLKSGKPIIKYLEFESRRVNKNTKNKNNNESIYIGYHGNKVHLLSMYPFAWKALSLLSRKYNIKVLLLYNHGRLGKLPNFMTKGIDVEYLQWNKKNLDYFLSQTDIGIVPNFTTIFFNSLVKRISMPFPRTFVTNRDDYLVSYKLTSGPNRILTFANNKIPIVADMYPSACQIINHEQNGFLVKSFFGWYDSLEKLIKDQKYRNFISENLFLKFKKSFDYHVQNKFFIESIQKFKMSKEIYPYVNDDNFDFRSSSIKVLYFMFAEVFILTKNFIRKFIK